MVITGVKKAVGDYKRAMALGDRSPRYAEIMLDCKTGEVWADVFYDIGHNEYKMYKSTSVINLTTVIAQNARNADEYVVNMQTVRQYAENCCQQYANTVNM